MAEKVQETILSTLADDLADNFFEGSANSSNIILPENNSEEKKEDKPEDKKDDKKQNSIKNPVIDFDTVDLLGDFLDQDEEPETPKEGDEEKRGPGRPKKDTNFGFEVEDLFEDDVLLPFADEQPIKSINDLKELIKANKVEAQRIGKEEALKEYKDNLPDSVKMILDYTDSGGNDITDFLKALGQAKRITDLDVEKEFDRKEIVRQYYQIQGWTPEEVDEEIESLLDIGEDKLKSVASKLKPKLDRMQEEALEYQLEQEKQHKVQQEQAQAFYVQNLVESIKGGNLGKLKLTKQEQRDIYSALIEERYPTINGGQTNRLGAILDKIQFVEPNYALLAEVTLFLSDPEAFKNKIRDQIQQEVTVETIKKVKSEQGLKKAGTSVEVPEKGKLKRLDSTFKNPFA